MGIEIERKFLVQSDAWRAATTSRQRLTQGYLCREPSRVVRVRVAGEQGFLTIKGAPQGLARLEFEYPIPTADARQLLQLADGPVIDKWRHLCPAGEGQVWEIDEFLGDNAGLIVAEIELQDEAQAFARPEWLGAEVTEDKRYLNANLAVRPFKSW